MKAIILAAGRGSRMKAMTDERPKCLLELYGKSLLERQLDAIRDAGVSEISIVTGYKREMLSSYGLKEFYNPRWAETNMVSSLACAAEWLKYEPCIVSYSDIFYSSDAVNSLTKSDADIAVTYDPNWLKLWENRFSDPLIDAETFKLNKDNTLAEIGNKPKTVDEVQGQYMGLLRFTPNGWNVVTSLRDNLSNEQCDQMHMTGTLQMLIESELAAVKGLSYHGKWGEVDTATDLDVIDHNTASI